MKPSLLLALSVICTSVEAGLSTKKSDGIAGFKIVNAERKKAGLRPYTWKEEFYPIAQKHTQYMMKVNKATHDDFHKSGGRADQMMKKLGAKLAGENCNGRTGSFFNPQSYNAELHKQFMNSPTHKHNIMNKKFTHMAMATTTSLANPKAVYTCQLYGIY